MTSLPSGDFAIGDDRDDRAIPTPIHDHRRRRECIPTIHVDGLTDYEALTRPTVKRRAEERARDILDAHAIDLAVKLRGEDAQGRLVSARNIVTAIALDARPIVRADAEERIRAAFAAAGTDASTAAHFARIAVESLP